MKHLILVRHGLTDWSVQNRRLGISDVPLNDQGRDQAEWLAEHLEGLLIDRVVSSDLERAMQTASSIAARHRLEVFPDRRLRERDHGIYEGTKREIENGADVTSRLDPIQAATAGVEDIDAVGDRVLAAYRDLKAAQGGTTVVVSHNGPLRMMIAASLGFGPEGRRRLEMDCGAFAVIRCGGAQDQLLALNVGGTYLERLPSLRR